jgi:hypothetical protein
LLPDFSEFGKWLHFQRINYETLTEESYGKYYIDFINSKLEDGESKRFFKRIEVMKD